MFHVRASPSLARALRLVEHDHYLTKDDKRIIDALCQGYAMPIPDAQHSSNLCSHRGPIVPYSDRAGRVLRKQLICELEEDHPGRHAEGVATWANNPLTPEQSAEREAKRAAEAKRIKDDLLEIHRGL